MEDHFKQLKRSRKKPQAGDIFAYVMPDGFYRFGRVIRTDIEWCLHFEEIMVMYFYRPTSTSLKEIPDLKRDDLLIPPQLILFGGWLEGSFVTVERRPLTERDVLPINCFWDHAEDRYCDEYGKKLPERIEPCGFFGVAGTGYVFSKLRKALGLPTSPPVSSDSSGPAAPADGKKKKRKRKRRDVEHSVTLYLADAGGGPLHNAPFEESLNNAAAAAGAGECTGHEYGLRDNDAYIYFSGKDADALAEALLPVLRAADLPKGSYLLKLYGEPGDAEERIDL